MFDKVIKVKQMNLTTGLAINSANYKVLNFKRALTLKVSQLFLLSYKFSSIHPSHHD